MQTLVIIAFLVLSFSISLAASIGLLKLKSLIDNSALGILGREVLLAGWGLIVVAVLIFALPILFVGSAAISRDMVEWTFIAALLSVIIGTIASKIIGNSVSNSTFNHAQEKSPK